MYQVWTKGDEYQGWARKDCPELQAALDEVLVAIKAGKEPLLTVEVMYEVGINVKEGKPEKELSAKEKFKIGIKESKKEAKSEAKESEAESNKVAGGESHSEV